MGSTVHARVRARITGGALLAAGVIAAPAAAQQGAPLRVHVRGSAQIESVAWAEPGGFLVRGTLLDDAGVPIAGGTLTIQIVGGGPRSELPQATTCAPPSRGIVQTHRASPEGYVVETDERGGFCLRGRAALGEAELRLRFAATKLYEGAERRIPLETPAAALSPVILRFDPPVDLVDLDREAVAVTAAIRIDRSDPGRPAGGAPLLREGLPLVLEDERGARLAEAQSGGDGRARFEVRTTSLDGPGQGELRVRFEGSDTLAKALASQPIVRRAQVALALAHPIEPADAEDGVPVDVDVTSSRGPVEGGVVEALRGAESVGAASVQAGKARVIAAFQAGREGRVPLTLRYVPSAPWWRAGPELKVEVPVKGPGAWRQILLGALVVAIAGWVLGGWRRAPKPPERADREVKAPPPSGRPGVQIVGPSQGARGWRGFVTDAHEGTPIPGAEIAIVVPSFQGNGLVASATSDAAGAFTLDAGYQADGRLVVTAPTHSTHEQALPPPSTIGIMLVTRRRALLDRVVRWARRQGAPFEGPPEPTPGHVRRVAGRAQDQEVEAWASRIEQAAFGPDEVDERLERDLRGAEPRRAPRGFGGAAGLVPAEPPSADRGSGA
jgi:hypothetical protein